MLLSQWQVFSNIEEYAPGFSDSIIGMEVLTPPDLEEIFGLTGGVSYA
jgi:phytoene dehydrogenase-like protein